jgi:RNA polymerase sigma-70 factor (ECF subfamily)
MREQKATHNLNSDEINGVIASCRQNDPKAQRALIQQYYGYVKSICLRYTSGDQDADEILNDSFLKILSNIRLYDVAQPFKSWVRKITVNTAIDHYRKSLRKVDNDSIENLQVVEVGYNILDQISAEEILAMVRKLTPAYRMVFSMYVLDGYSHKEIAGMLGIHEGTSKSNLQDARKKLQLMILKHNPDLFNAYALKNSTTNEE